jgi:hypothetical protein
MSITLQYGANVLPLDDDLLWVDEYQYSPVEASVDVSLTGALIEQVDGDASRPGRPITLQPPDDNSAWMIREDIDQLQAWGAIAGAQFTLTLRGVARQVKFRHQEKPAVDAKPVVPFSDPLPSDYYLATLKFMEV